MIFICINHISLIEIMNSTTTFYDDLLFEIYHYIDIGNIMKLNKISKKMNKIHQRIRRYIFKQLKPVGLIVSCNISSLLSLYGGLGGLCYAN
jgi:hypothetical protein